MAVPGQQILIEGSGFVAGDRVSSVSIGNQTAVVHATADSAGNIVIAVNVPSSPRGPGIGFGKKTVSVAAVGSGRVAEGSIEIPKASITLDPATSRRGTTVNVSGSGFPSRDLVLVKYDINGTFRTLTTGSVDASGAVSIDFVVPSSANIGSKHNVEVTSLIGRYKSVTAKATHTVPDALVTLSTDTISSGENITITGRNLPAFAAVAMMEIGGIDVRPCSPPATSIDGDFESTVLVPLLEPGIHTVSVRVSQTTATAPLEIDTTVPVPPAQERPDATVTLSSDTISNGEYITITGRNFPAFNKVAVIEIGGQDVRSCPPDIHTSIDGHFESTVLVPQLEPGYLIVWVRVGQTTATTFLEIVASMPQAIEHSATRSFSATTVAPGGELTVNIALSDYEEGGSVTETLPGGFSLVSNSVDFIGGGGFARPSGNMVNVVLTGAGVTNVIYKVTAPSEAGGPFEFTGTFVNLDGESVDIGGVSTVTVAADAGTAASYDSNGNGTIELPELFDAIDDYFGGEISLIVLFDIIDFYFSGGRVG